MVLGGCFDLFIVVIQRFLRNSNYFRCLLEGLRCVLLAHLPPLWHLLENFPYSSLSQPPWLLFYLFLLFELLGNGAESSNKNSDDLLADEVLAEYERGSKGKKSCIDVVMIGGMEIENLMVAAIWKNWVRLWYFLRGGVQVRIRDWVRVSKNHRAGLPRTGAWSRSRGTPGSEFCGGASISSQCPPMHSLLLYYISQS